MASAWGAAFGKSWGNSWAAGFSYTSAPDDVSVFAPRNGASQRIALEINDRSEQITDSRIEQLAIERLPQDKSVRLNELMAARPTKQTGKRNAVQSRSRS
jgi:hypothetical protein